MRTYSYEGFLRGSMRKILLSFKNPPSKRRYPEQSKRQARAKYYTTVVNGFTLMQRLPRGASSF